MPRPKHCGRIPIYTDSTSQSITRRVSLAEAYKLVESNPCYQWMDDEHRAVCVRTETTPLRPKIAITITASEIMINAGVSKASDPRIAEVKTKIAIYNDTGMQVYAFCPWPPPPEVIFAEAPKGVGMDGSMVSEEMKQHLALRLGLRV